MLQNRTQVDGANVLVTSAANTQEKRKPLTTVFGPARCKHSGTGFPEFPTTLTVWRCTDEDRNGQPASSSSSPRDGFLKRFAIEPSFDTEDAAMSGGELEAYAVTTTTDHSGDPSPTNEHETKSANGHMYYGDFQLPKVFPPFVSLSVWHRMLIENVTRASPYQDFGEMVWLDQVFTLKKLADPQYLNDDSCDRWNELQKKLAIKLKQYPGLPSCVKQKFDQLEEEAKFKGSVLLTRDDTSYSTITRKRGLCWIS